MAGEENGIRQMTLRLSDRLYEETKMRADNIGSSHNSYLLMLISLGMKVYTSDEIILRKQG